MSDQPSASSSRSRSAVERESEDVDAPVGCPSEELLGRFMSEECDADEKAEIRAHVDVCARCADTLAMFLGAFDDGTGLGASTSAMRLEVGDRAWRGRFADRYEIQRCVGFGAGGTVYAAYDPELERVVALKVLRASEGGGSTEPNARWTREAKGMARVVHPNVVMVHDVGVWGGNPFIAAEFIEGSTLDVWREERSPGWGRVLEVFVAAAHGLAAIHDGGLVHRDFKPSNVMVGDDGRVRVTDFGLARVLPDLDDVEDEPTAESQMPIEQIAETMLSRTRTGTLIGTPAYMSPEQWKGRAADARSDQFSLCVALYEALFGMRPFAADSTVDLAQRVLRGSPTPPPRRTDVPRWLVGAVMKGLSRAPEDRHESIEALINALAEGPRRVRRRRLSLAIAGSAAAVAGLGYAVASLPSDACTVDERRFEGKWDAAIREEVRTALAPGPPGTADRMTQTLDAWTGRWRETARSVCEDQRADRTSEHQHELAVVCLDRRLAELAAVTDVLQSGDPLRASDVVAGLTSPERCADVETLARIEPTYGSAEARAFARDQVEAIERIRSLRAAGKLVPAKEAAEAAVREANAQGDPAVRATALVALGQTLSMLREPRPAEEVLREAVWAAEASGHVEAAADGWIELINVVGILSERYDEGRRAAERGAAAVHRLGSPTHAMQLAGNRAVVASLAGDYADALADQREVLQQAIELYGPQDPQVARVHLNIAAALNHLGRLEEAHEHALEGLRIQRAAHPGAHPATCQMLNSIGVLELQLGRYEDAQEHLDLGIAIANETLPEGNATTATLEATRVHLYLRDGDFAAAEAGMRRSIAIYERVNGREHPDVALAMHNLASIIDKSGEEMRAIETYRQALELKLATVGPQHPATAATLHNLGLMLFDTKVDVGEGIELMERAKTIRDAQKLDPYKRATTRYMLARAYLQEGQRDKAIRYAEEASEFLASVAPLHADVARNVNAWLAKYRDGAPSAAAQ